MFRCAVPSPRTDRVSLAAPPSAQPTTKPTARNSTPARMPPGPQTATTLRTFNNVCNTISAIRLRFDVLSKNGLICGGKTWTIRLDC